MIDTNTQWAITEIIWLDDKLGGVGGRLPKMLHNLLLNLFPGQIRFLCSKRVDLVQNDDKLNYGGDSTMNWNSLKTTIIIYSFHCLSLSNGILHHFHPRSKEHQDQFQLKRNLHTHPPDSNIDKTGHFCDLYFMNCLCFSLNSWQTDARRRMLRKFHPGYFGTLQHSCSPSRNNDYRGS